MKSVFRSFTLLSLLGLLALLVGTIAAPPARAQAVRSYEITITNLTDRQIFSPPLLVTHDASIHLWERGQLASDGLRVLAEDGDNGPLATTLRGSATEVVALEAPLMPGASTTVSIQAAEGDVLSIASMLVQSNDAFTGVDSLSLDGMMGNEVIAYDAGTEENSEAATDVPGPPFGGMARVPTTPAQPISEHPGLGGDADVGSEFGWTGAVARITVAEGTMGDEMMDESESMMDEGSETMGEGTTMMDDAAGAAPEVMPETGASSPFAPTPALALTTFLLGLLLIGGAFATRLRAG